MTTPRRRTRLLAAAYLAAASALAFPATAGDVPADAATLIEKHVAWLGGWKALDDVRDLTLEGTIRVAGLEGPLTVRARRDGRQLTEVDLKVVKSVEALSGETGWERNASGQIEEMGQEKAAQERRSLDRTFNRHLRGEGAVVSVAGRETREGRDWTVVRFAYTGGDRYELLVDPATGESLFTRTVTDGRALVTKVSDFRTVNGLRTAFRQETEGENARQKQTVTWRRIETNTGLSDSLFARPTAAPRLIRLPAGRTSTEWAPVELHQRRYVFLRGEVNGVATDVVLDSGAGMTVVDRALAAKLGLRAEGDVEARGTGGSVGASFASGVTVTLAGIEIGPLSAAVLDMSDVGKRLGRPLPVILGKEVFHALVVDLDYPASRIRFLDPGPFRYEGPGRKLELLPEDDGHKNVRLSIEGGAPVVVGLDTGQGGALSVFRHYAEERGFLTGRPVSEARGGGVGGATTMKTATLRTVTIAGYELRDVPAAFPTVDVGGAFDTKRQAGNLGAGLLSRFRVLFDYPHGVLWLEPGPHLAAPLPKDRCGLGLQWADGSLTVAFVAPGSPAAAAGWKAGERVAALDGKPAGADYWKTMASWADATAGTEVSLTLADGTLRKLVLRDFY